MAQSIVVPSGDRLEFPDGMPDSEIEKAIHAEYPDLAPKPSLMSRAGAALKPAEREPMPSTADTISAGWTNPPEERLSVPGSVMDQVLVSRLPATPPPSIESEGSFAAASRKLRTNQDAAAVSAERAAMPSATAIQPGTPSAGDFAKAVKVGMTDIGTIAGKGLRYLGAEDFGSLLQSAGQRQAKETQRGMTPAGQMAMDAPIVTDEIEWGETPMASASLQALRSAPSMIAALPFGGVAAKGIEAAGGATLKALAAHPGIIGRIATLAPTAIGAGGAEGIQAALMNAAQTETEIMELPIQQLRGSPKFQELMAQADPAIPLAQRERQVRAAIAKLASDEVARRTFVSTGGIGILTGGGAQGVLLRQMEGKGAKTILGAAGKGTVEEAIQEAPQSAAEQYIQNVATQNYVDPAASASQGVISAGLSGGIVGGLTGGVMGAGGRILSGPPGQEKAPSPRAELDAILASDKPVAEILAAQAPAAEPPQATPQAPIQPAAYGWPDIKTPAVATLPDGQVITGQIAGIQDSDGQPMARFVGADGQVWMIQPGEADIKPAPAGDGTRTAPVQAETAEHVKIAERAVNTDPSEAQKEAGNYQLGHLAIQGLDIAIENPAGSVRSGVGKDGKPWSNTLNHAYGFFKGATAADGDKLDVFIGPDPQSQQVFVIDQIDPDTGKYDEGKVILGASSIDEARNIYLSNYDTGWKGLGAITPMVMPAFKAWIAKGETHKPLAYDQKAAIAERKTAADTQKAGEAYAAERENAVAAIGENQVAAIEDQVADQNAGQPTIELYRAITTALKAEAARQATQPAAPAQTPAAPSSMAQPEPVAAAPIAAPQPAAVAPTVEWAVNKKAKSETLAYINGELMGGVFHTRSPGTSDWGWKGMESRELHFTQEKAMSVEREAVLKRYERALRNRALDAATPTDTPTSTPPATPKQLEMKARAAKNIDAYLNQNAAGRWQLSQPIDDADLRNRVIDEMDRRNQGEVNAAQTAQSPLPAVPQEARKGAALPEQVAKQSKPNDTRFVIKRDDVTGDKVEWQGKSSTGEWQRLTTFDTIDAARAASSSQGYGEIPVLESTWNAKAKRFSVPKEVANGTPNEPAAAPAPGQRGAILDDARQAVPQGTSASQTVPDAAAQDQGSDRGAVAEERAYTKGQAEVLARRMTNQGLPSEAYPHPTEAGMWAIRVPGEEQPADAGADFLASNRAEFRHEGFRIYPISIKGEPRWAVQSVDNAEKEANGERQIGGDAIVDAPEQAKQQAERQVTERAQKAERRREAAEQAAAYEAKKEANRGLSITQRRANAALDKPTNLPVNAGVGRGTRREAMESAVSQERAITAVDVRDTAAYKRDEDEQGRLHRAGYGAFFGNDSHPQKMRFNELTAKLKNRDNYQKKEYRLYMGRDTEGSFYDITKTEYDYAHTLIATKKAEASTPAPSAPTAKKEPWQYGELEYGDKYIDEVVLPQLRKDLENAHGGKFQEYKSKAAAVRGLKERIDTLENHRDAKARKYYASLDDHYAAVRRALAAGKDVPAVAYESYDDLKADVSAGRIKAAEAMKAAVAQQADPEAGKPKDEQSAEQKIRDAMMSGDTTIGKAKAITIEHNGRTQTFLGFISNVPSAANQARGLKTPITLARLKLGKMLATMPTQLLVENYTLNGRDVLSQAGNSRPATDDDIKQWEDAGLEVPADAKPKVASEGKPVATKEPWQMTREEAADQFPGDEYDKMLNRAAVVGDISYDEAHKRSRISSIGRRELWAQTRADLLQEKKDAIKSARGERADINKLKPTAEFAPWRIKSMSATGKAAIESAGKYYDELLAVHKDRVQEAIEEGKDVPAEVLADYPDLATKEPAQGAEKVGAGKTAITEVKDIYGRTHRVRESDLKGEADRLPTVRQNGDVVVGEEIPRSIIRKSDAGETANKPDTGIAFNSIAEFADPSKDEAERVQAGIEGKDIIGAAQWLVDNAPPMHSAIAAKVLASLKRQQSDGMVFEFHVMHPGDSVPMAATRGRGATSYNFDFRKNVVAVWINGADVIGKVGTSYETVLHELVHAVTVSATAVGRKAAGTEMQKHVFDLEDVTNAVIDHFNQRVKDAAAGKVELTEFEKSIQNRGSNAFASIDETLAWTLSSPDAQAYLEAIPYKSKSAWTAFVEAIRKILGLTPRHDTALSEVLRVSEAIMEDVGREMRGLLGLDGIQHGTLQPSNGTGMMYSGAVSKDGPINSLEADHQSAVSRAIDRAIAQESEPQTDTQRGAGWLKIKLRQAQNKGELSAKAVEMVEWLVKQNPALVKYLAVAVENPKVMEDGDDKSVVLESRAAMDTYAKHSIDPENVPVGDWAGRTIFHGTSDAGADSIHSDGVIIDKSTGGYFGVGFYAATDAGLAANNYADFAEENDIEGKGSVIAVRIKDTARILDLRDEKDWEAYQKADPGGRGLSLRDFAEKMTRQGIDGLFDRSFGGVVIYNPKAIEVLPDAPISANALESRENQPTTGAAGNYNPLTQVMTLFRGNASDTTAIHEILHHLERMMPAEMQAEIRKEWLRAVTGELQKAQKDGDQKRIDYFTAVLAGDQKKATELLTGKGMDGFNAPAFRVVDIEDRYDESGYPLPEFEVDVPDDLAKRMLAAYNRSASAQETKLGRVEDSEDIGAKTDAFIVMAEAEGYTVGGDRKYLTLSKKNGPILHVRLSDHANVNRGVHFGENPINIAPGDGINPVDTFASALFMLRNAVVDENGDTKFNAVEPAPTFKAVDTESAEFKAWFGASKAVDADGKPMRVYHGTENNFDAFDNRLAGANTRHPTARLGFFTTTSAKVANVFIKAKTDTEAERSAFRASNELAQRLAEAAGYGSVYQMSPHSPERKAIHSAAEGAYAENDFRERASVMPVYLSLQNPLTISWDEWYKAADWISGTSEDGIRELMQKVKDGNHDGIHLPAQPGASREYAGDTYIAFDSAQIKSSISNTGAFSRTDPRITQDLAIGQDYQYLTPSEFWAVRMTSTAQARFDAKSIWARSLQWLREALEHIKGALGLKSDHPLLKALDDLIARGNGEFVSKEMLGSSEVYASIEESGPEEVAGVVMRDVSLAARLLLHPRQIAANHKPFVPVFDTAIKQFEERDRIVSGLGEMAKPYFELTHAQRLNVNKIVEQGRLDRTVYTVADLENGIHHAESGDLVTLDAEEIGAYKSLRKTFNEALSLFRDTMLEEFGFAELIPEAKAAAKLRQMIADGEIEESRIEWARHVAKAIDEIEQAKRTGYAPFNRYGQFVVAVKALPAGVEVQDDDGKQLVTGIPEDGDDPLTQIVTDLGGQYDVFRDGWVIDDTRKAVLRALETTLFATKVEVNAFNEWRKQGKDVTAIPEVKAAFDEAKRKYGKAPNARVLAFHITEKAKADDANLSTFDELARISDVDVETWDAVREKLQEAIKAKSFRKHFFGSDNTPGYSVDFERSVADYIIGMSGYLARRKHVKDFDNAIKRIKAPALAKYAEDYRKYVNAPADEFALLKNIGFLYYIAGSTATAVANLTQVPMLTMPTLVQFVPHHIAAREVARAWGETLAMFSPTKTGLQMFDPAKVPADVRDVFKAAWEDQLFVPLETLDLMAASSIKTVGGRKTMRALSVTTQAIAYMFMFAERLNRITTFIAAARISRMKVAKDRMRDVVKNDAWARHSIGGRAWGERNFAEWAVDESQYRMGKVNRPTVMRGVGSPLLQFKGYMIQTLEAGYRMAVMHGKGGKPAALAALAMMLMLGGLWGLPGLEDLRDMIERLYKLNTGKDLDLKTEVRQLIARETGSATLAAAANKGIPYATVGVDMSRVGLGNIVPDSALQVGGIPADLAIGRPWRASEKMMAGKPVEAMSEFLPNFIKNPAMGLQWKFDGLRDKLGTRMMTPGQFDYGDVAIKSLGWTPTKVTNRREYTYAESRAERGIDELKRRYTNDLVRTYVLADEAKDPAEKAEYEADHAKALAKIEEHNKTASPENMIDLDPQTLRRKAATEFSGSAAREGKERKLSRGEAVKRRELFQLR